MARKDIINTDGSIKWDSIGSLPDKIGLLSGLQTTDKTDLVKAINENTSQLADTAIRVKDYKLVGDTDDTESFNRALVQALNTNAGYVLTEAKTYICEGDLSSFDEMIVCIGKGKIVSSNPNNRYFKIYDLRTLSGILTAINPAYKFENLLNFAKKLVIAKGGGAKVKIVWVGDSITQGGHRIGDNFWWVQHLQNKLIKQFGDYFEFYNRGIAGTAIGSLNNVLSSPVISPYQADWVTNSGVKTWLNYINDVNPDLIFCAFGMNEPDANGYKSIVDGRALLKSISSNPDIVWVTSPIRTINTQAVYNSELFGTYPKNEYSNNAGILTRLVGENFGDPVIDVNRNTSISYLGFDPYQYRFNRWFGQYRSIANTFSGDTAIISGGDSNPIALDMSGSRIITSKRLFRNFSMEFTPTLIGNLNPLRIGCRKDPNSISEIVFLVSNTKIEYYGISVSSGGFGVLKTWTGDCRGKTVRIEVIGTCIRVYVQDIGWVIDEKSALATQFIAPLTLLAQSDTNCVLNNVNINGDEYKQYVPRITANEVFNVYYSDGGNGLNHPNTKGELELYEQPLNEFVSSLSNIEYLSNINTSLSPTETSSITLPGGVTGTLTYLKSGKVVTLLFNDITGTFGNGASLVVLPTNLRPSNYPVRGVLSRIGNGTQDIMSVDIRNNGNVYVYNAPVGGVTYSGNITFIIS